MENMEHTAKSVDNLKFHKLCRICGMERPHLMPIYYAEGKEHDIASKINLHFPMISISESDQLPLQVCHECASTVIIFHQLYENCAETNKHFCDIMQQVSTNVFNSRNDRDILTDVSVTSGKEEINFELNEDDFSVWEITVDEHSVDQQLDGWVASVADGWVASVADETCDDSLTYCDEPPRRKHLRIEEDGSITVKYDEDNDSPNSKQIITRSTGNRNIEENESIAVKCDDDNDSKNSEKTIKKRTGKRNIEENESITMKYNDDNDLKNSEKTITRRTGKRNIQENESITVKYDNDNDSQNSEQTITKSKGNRKQDSLRGRACYECGMVFQYRRDAVKHANAKHGNLDIYSCPICGDKMCFLLAGDLQEHLLRRHVPEITDTYETFDEESEPQALAPFCKVAIVQCDSIGFENENFVNLLTKKFLCRYCHLAFGNEYLLKRHIAWNHARDSLNYSCQLCGNAYGNKNALKVHIETSHMNVRCDICFKTLPAATSKEELDRHRKMHVLRGRRWPILTKYSCFVCGEAFDEKALCVSHANDHDSDDQVFSNCSICYRFFRKIGQLQNHLFQVHSPDFAEINVNNKYRSKLLRPIREKPPQSLTKFTCFLCGDSFDDSKDCEIHAQNAHADVAVLKCPVCDNVYARADLLQRHLLSVHIPYIVTSPSNDANSNKCDKDAAALPIKSKSGSKLEIACSVCSRSFANKRKRDIHLEMHGPAGSNWPILTKYTCFVCGLAFENSGLCQTHVGNSHSSEVTLNCKICGATFSYPEHLQSHLFYIHSPQIVKPCNKDKKFTRKSTHDNRSPVAKKRRISQRDGFQNHSIKNNLNDKHLYECTICKMKFMELSSIKDHIAEFHLGEETKKKCAFCDLSIDNNKLAQHWLEKHAEITTPRCEICCQDFPNTQIFTQHCFEAHVQNSFKIIHSDDKLEIKFEVGKDGVVCSEMGNSSDSNREERFNLLICPFCEAVATSQEEFTQHANEKHPEKLSFPCAYCPLKFDTFENKETHATTKHSNIAQGFENYCKPKVKNKIRENSTFEHFPNSNDCEQTLFEGVNELPYRVCLICNRSFNNNVSLERHLKRKHEPTWPVLVKYTCFACGEAFNSKMDCFKHARDVHTDDASLVCPVCCVTFSKADQLQKHLFATHTPTYLRKLNENEILADSLEEKLIVSSYKCGKCDLIFSSTLLLHRHMNAKHSKCNQFVCLFCAKSYVSKYSLKRHYNDSHRDKDPADYS